MPAAGWSQSQSHCLLLQLGLVVAHLMINSPTTTAARTIWLLCFIWIPGNGDCAERGHNSTGIVGVVNEKSNTLWFNATERTKTDTQDIIFHISIYYSSTSSALVLFYVLSPRLLDLLIMNSCGKYLQCDLFYKFLSVQWINLLLVLLAFVIFFNSMFYLRTNDIFNYIYVSLYI